MARPEAISFAFLESHPDAAARVLERIEAGSVAALFSEAPARLAAPVLRAMLPLYAARCLEPLDDADAARLLQAMGAQAGTGVLRYLLPARRAALMVLLPTTSGLAFRLLLGYPEDTVGAWMNPRLLAVPEDLSVAGALERVRQGEPAGEDRIYVTGADQRLLGVVSAAQLLRAGADEPLRRVYQSAAFTLPARSRVRRIAGHRAWDTAQTLPVVERNERLVGVLDRAAVVRALGGEQTEHAMESGDVPAAAASAYWTAVSGLIEAAVTLIPVAQPSAAERPGER